MLLNVTMRPAAGINVGIAPLERAHELWNKKFVEKGTGQLAFVGTLLDLQSKC